MSGGLISMRYFIEERLEQLAELPLQSIESFRLRERGLVHVKALVDLDLQTVAPGLRIGISAHQLDALVRVVHLHVVAHAGERAAHELGEGRIAGGAVAVPQHEIGPHAAGAVIALLAGDAAHRVAIDVIDAPEAAMRRVKMFLEIPVIRRVTTLDALAHSLGQEPAPVDGAAILQRAPDERLADARLAAGPVFPG